jgi:hypothetical protein
MRFSSLRANGEFPAVFTTQQTGFTDAVISIRVALTLLCMLGWAGTNALAQAPSTSGQICSPAMLDVSALPSPPTFAYGGHIFVFEVQNTSSAACSLQLPQVVLEPPSDTNNQPFYAAWRSSDPGFKAESQPQVLEPGAWAHLLLVWTSRAGPELGCNQYSGLRLRFAPRPEREGEALIEVRHLWIRACGMLGVTGYRMGRYDGSPVPQSWLDWYGPDGLHGLAFASPVTSKEIAADSSLLLLSAQAKRTMLGDRLFSLKLNFPRLAAAGCAFSQLRKRESDGSTIISIQQCDDVVPDKTVESPAVPWYHDPGVMGLYLGMGNLELFPKHAGPLQYDVTAPVGRSISQKATMQYARTRVELVARDPTLPLQAAILDPLQACSPNQLHIVALSPAISTPLKTLRAYNATNISQQACSLAGVPRTRGLDDKGDYQPFLPLVCPNCDNDLFKARPNGRIDIKPGETAHLLAGATGDGRRCTSTPKLEMSLNRAASPTEPLNTRPLPADIAQSATVPFEAQDCVSIDISAWRQGHYDGDPLNLHRAKPTQTSEAASEGPVPTECDKPELLVNGRPRMIEGTHNPEYGLSMVKREFVKDESIPIYVWMNNSSNDDLRTAACGWRPYFMVGGFVLYDAYGHRVLDKNQIALEMQCRVDPAGNFTSPAVTLCVQLSSFPAHTCTSNRVDLTMSYELPPGEYFLSTRDPGDAGSCPHQSNKPFQPNPSTDISFEVLQP